MWEHIGNNLKIEVDTVLEQSLKPSEDTDGKQTAEREFPDDKSIGHLEEDIEEKQKEIVFITVDRDSEIIEVKSTSPVNETSPTMHPQEAQPSRERLMVLREGPMIKEETLDESGDSELEKKALEAEK